MCLNLVRKTHAHTQGMDICVKVSMYGLFVRAEAQLVILLLF